MSDRNHKFSNEEEFVNYISGHALCVRCNLRAWEIFRLFKKDIQNTLYKLYRDNCYTGCYPEDLELFNKHSPCLTDEEVIIKKLLE
jgi:hypothetical protein